MSGDNKEENKIDWKLWKRGNGIKVFTADNGEGGKRFKVKRPKIKAKYYKNFAEYSASRV